jgi:hypothetical protein
MRRPAWLWRGSSRCASPVPHLHCGLADSGRHRQLQPLRLLQPTIADYPKWGLTPNVYYQTQNLFCAIFGRGSSFLSVNVCAYDGAAKRAGKPAKQVCIMDNSNGTLFDDNMLPTDDDTAASAGIASEVMLGSIDNFLPGDTHVYEYVFTVSFPGKGSAVLAGINGTLPIDVPAFNLRSAVRTACSPAIAFHSRTCPTCWTRWAID